MTSGVERQRCHNGSLGCLPHLASASLGEWHQCIRGIMYLTNEQHACVHSEFCFALQLEIAFFAAETCS